MNSRLKKVLLTLAAVMMLTVLGVVSVFATSGETTYEPTAEENGVTATISTDKDSYSEGDLINVTLSVENKSGEPISNGTIIWGFSPSAAVSQSSSGMVLPQTMSGINDGESGEVSGDLEVDASKLSGNGQSGNNSAGGSMIAVIIVVVVIVVIIAVVVIVILMKRKGKKPPVSLLAIALVLGAVASASGIAGIQTASAASEDIFLLVSKTVSYEGKDVTVKAAVQITFGEKVVSIPAESRVNYSTVAVHDPSIIKDNGKYYVFGTMEGVATSDDLMNWTSVYTQGNFPYVNGSNANEAFSKDKNAYTGTVKALVNGKVADISFKPSSGNGFDVRNFVNSYVVKNNVKYVATDSEKESYDLSGNYWAPDIVYNETMGKYCLYTSLNGQNWNSAIVLMTSDDILGPYEYQGPVIYSGFDDDASLGNYYKNTDLELVLGELSELPSRYNHLDSGNPPSSNWGDYLPHCIDPAVTYDDDGNLWMIYGSWSGGIYIIQLDETTGLRDYTVEYPNEDEGTKTCTSDAYFGKRIAGGQYVSGEGSYIEKIGDYYWLFVSYGFYAPGTGYNMRVYRSETIDGEYVDLLGNSAKTSSWELTHASARGVRLFGGYRWPYMTSGSTAQGHNSAYYDADLNKAFVIYHRKWDDDSIFHQVETHQLFLNEDGWLVAAPFKYAGETISETGYDAKDIVGDYDIIIHSKVQGLNYDSVLPNGVGTAFDIHTAEQITLNEDGTVTGAYEGTWTAKDGTCYMTITLDDEEYKGVFCTGYLEDSNIEVMTFTALGDINQYTIWGAQSVLD